MAAEIASSNGANLVSNISTKALKIQISFRARLTLFIANKVHI